MSARAGRPGKLRSFDLVVLAELEYRAWVGYYRRNWFSVLVASIKLVRQGFGMDCVGAACRPGPLAQAHQRHRGGALEPPGSHRGASHSPDTVAATSARNAWAVSGVPVRNHFNSIAMFEHWNGANWKVRLSTKPGQDGAILFSVAATSVSSAWAVGIDTVPVTFTAVIEHWNGKAWKLRRSPIIGCDLNAVAAIGGQAWAVGGTASQAVIEHWTGHAWRGFAVK